MHFAWTPSENARSARAELETIGAALPSEAIARHRFDGSSSLEEDDARIADEAERVI